MSTNDEEWVTMREAARRLSVQPSMLTRIAKKEQIRTREDPIDSRVKLVEINEVRTLLESSIRYKKPQQFKLRPTKSDD